MSMSDNDYRACELSKWDGETKHCRWCNVELTGRRRRWCSDDCANTAWGNHYWGAASYRRQVIDKRRCECGEPAREVHHETPILGRHGEMGCHHHVDGLRSLCLECHRKRHRPDVAGDQLAMDAV